MNRRRYLGTLAALGAGTFAGCSGLTGSQNKLEATVFEAEDTSGKGIRFVADDQQLFGFGIVQ